MTRNSVHRIIPQITKRIKFVFRSRTKEQCLVASVLTDIQKKKALNFDHLREGNAVVALYLLQNNASEEDLKQDEKYSELENKVRLLLPMTAEQAQDYVQFVWAGERFVPQGEKPEQYSLRLRGVSEEVKVDANTLHASFDHVILLRTLRIVHERGMKVLGEGLYRMGEKDIVSCRSA